jgi:hypothetical protein
MAGTIIADTLTHSTAGSVTTDYVVNGSAKAWANIQGSGTAAIDDSLNTSGLVDNGTGNYTLSFTNSLSNVVYAPTMGGRQSGANIANTFADGPGNMLTGSVVIKGYNNDASPAARDYDPVIIQISGDLA